MLSPILFAGPAVCLYFFGEYDPASEDGERYRDKLANAGVSVELKVFLDAIHRFFNMGVHLGSTFLMMSELAKVCAQIQLLGKFTS